MPVCKECSQVRSVVRMREGICFDCLGITDEILMHEEENKKKDRENKKVALKKNSMRKSLLREEFSLSNINEIKNSKVLSYQEKKDLIIKRYENNNYTIDGIHDGFITFSRKAQFSWLWAIFFLIIVPGLGFLVYIALHSFMPNERVSVNIGNIEGPSDNNTNTTKSNVDRMKELAEMYENKLITQEEFEKLKSEVLKSV